MYYNCDICNSTLLKTSKTRHENTNKHQTRLIKQTEQNKPILKETVKKTKIEIDFEIDEENMSDFFIRISSMKNHGSTLKFIKSDIR